jgi:hypothetical protein
LGRDNDDIIYYYCGYSAEEVILRNNFESISAITGLRPKGQYNNNKQKLNKNLAFGELLILLILICGDVAINPGPDYQSSEEFTNECLKLWKLKGIKILHLNARSLVNKINEMRIICNKSMPDLLCISESWLNNGHEDVEFRITGYDLYRKDKMFANGGGVCLFVKKSNSFAVNVIENNNNLEMICVEVSQKNTKPFAVIVVYRPPDASIEYTNELLHYLENNSNTETIITGDINKDYLNKSNAKYFDNYSDLGFKQLIDENTRIAEESESCIDLVFTNNLNNIGGFGTLNISLSDHKPVYVSRKLNFYSKKEKTGVHNEMRYKDWKNLDLNSLSNEVPELNLNFNFQESNTELMCEQYFNQLSQLQNKYVIKKF